MAVIKKIHAREILDSRGNPTIEVEVLLSDDSIGNAMVPSGASTGEHEAKELRDNNPKRYMGKGVLKAIKNINGDINKMLRNMPTKKMHRLDKIMIEMDDTKNKEYLGANAILGTSLAIWKAHCISQNIEPYQIINTGEKTIMPIPFMNIINGGAHADNKLDFQEFMIVPHGAKSFKDAIRMGAEVFHTLKKLLKKKKYNTNVGDEGGFAPMMKNTNEAIECIIEAIEKAKYKPNKDISIALDCAASEIYKNQKYNLIGENKIINNNELAQYLEKLCQKYPIVSIEDGMDQNDWNGWKILTQKIGKKCQIVGDDLFATNKEILKKGIKENIANAILIKPNQIGTLSETIETILIAQENKYNCMMSHRSGETEDTSIADLAIMTQCQYIKAGSLSRSERIAKYNRLIKIEDQLGRKAIFNNINA